MIKTKYQNIFLGILVAIIVGFISSKSYVEFTSNSDKITSKEYSQLEDGLKNVNIALKRHFNLYFESFGELFYDKDIEKAVFMRNTRTRDFYRRRAYESLREFALFKKVKDIFIFDTEYNLLTKFNRNIRVKNSHIELIKNRLEDYKERQVIFQKIGEVPVVIFIMKLEYTANNSGYVVTVKKLSEFIKEISKFETDAQQFILFSRTLEYKNSLLPLNGPESLDLFSLQENTLIRYNRLSSDGYNAKGEKVKSKLSFLSDYQYSFVLGIIKPKHLEETIEESHDNIKQRYKGKFVALGFLLLAYLGLLLSKTNLIDEMIFTIGAIRRKIFRVYVSEEKAAVQDLAKRAKEEAFSYMDDKEMSIQNSMLNIYKSIKRMSPEDIRNLSIKNSLSKENIRLVYQAVYDAKTLKPQFCEVYLRLLNYYAEELMPSEFIPVLKHFHMLENLDEMMLEKVVSKVKSLYNKDPSAQISLNISKGAFVSKKFRQKLHDELLSESIHPENVMLEIPTFDMLNDPESEAFFKELAEKNIQIAVSLEYVNSDRMKKILANKVSYIKIDMMYFSDVLENVNKQADLKDILMFARKNNVYVIAERIETELMFKLAQSLDVNLLQGFYLSRPKRYFTHK